MNDPFKVLKELNGSKYYSLPALESEAGLSGISRLPVSIRIVLESVLRNCDGKKVKEEDVTALANWSASERSSKEIPFVVSRVVLQDFTGVPLLVDLAAMRDAVTALGKDPALIEPLVPVDLVVDHSVQVDRSGSANAFLENLKIEFSRNKERYQFLKWGQQAFDTFSVVPPAIGIVHQVNLEHLAKVVFEKDGILYPDTLVGTDSHTTMINGLGIVGWGVGGIEAESGMLGQPVYFQTPEVVGVHLTGELPEGTTATDLTLRITQILREAKVVGKFVEFYGDGAAQLSLADRATVANMAPEYGATMGFFPVDEKSLDYLRLTGRQEAQIERIRSYYQAQNMFGIPQKGEIDYSVDLELDISTIVPCVSGPKRPQDRIEVPALKEKFTTLLSAPTSEGGFGIPQGDLNKTVRVTAPVAAGGRDEPTGGVTDLSNDEGAAMNETEMVANRPATPGQAEVHDPAKLPPIAHGQVLIAAITSCTNTSNPSVMIAAGLVARKAREKGLKVNPLVKTSLGPGSRVVTDYLKATDLQDDLDALGFQLVGYGCTTCIGNSGPLDPAIEDALKQGNIIGASVLSGNRNFEARVHGALKASFLMSPPLVVAYALAGNVNIDLANEPIGNGNDGKPIYLKDIWPSNQEIEALVLSGLKPEMFRSKYGELDDANPEWNAVQSSTGDSYEWDSESTYIQSPPFFEGFSMEPGTITDLKDLRPLAIAGDSITTDHISPAGAIKEDGPAGRYLAEHGVAKKDFNSFGSRRGNDRIMTRGTFANVRFKNKMADGKEGGYTKLMPEGKPMDIYDACQQYKHRGTGLIIITGEDYGMGSSRDWAAKGTALLGVRAVVAKSFERIHRSNLIGMGVLPFQLPAGVDDETLDLTGEETFSITGLSDTLKPGQTVPMEIKKADGSTQTVELTVRIDTDIEVEYYRHGGILQYVLRDILSES
ncbi:aconitate hydratase [Coraliomargarita sp. SDUM461004]|uniref:Aconitate hydratase A n=1 Tax=Thalassobacterium sedimentorum TaxID=3041258 RepID=A0ABU1AJV0_9BACT|nr:aconitate hydratase [Coraliomargarita sp. SDUM461004]MDQ8194031.1 aconitate hydratase [Coraliomargarita sp. SDUM461004]